MNEKMNVTLPDNRVPIRVGDPSFIYENVYHPIVWIGEAPYRPRVELLLVKDKRYVFLQKIENNHSGENENYPYRIPGGSIDPDSTKLQQAINETEEEGLRGVKNAINPGVQYYEQYKPGFLDTHQFPIEYAGTINDVFVGEFNGKNIPEYQIEEKDRDKDMATKGRFHAISMVASFLRTEHIRALIASGKLDKDVETICKIELSRVRGYAGLQTSSPSYQAIKTITMESMDPEMIPGGKLYHGTDMKIDVFHPMSLDLGNIYQEPGWSTFCFDNRLMALRFGLMRVLQRVTKQITNTSMNSKWIGLDVKWSIRYGKPYCNGYRVNVSLFKNDPIYIYTFHADKLNDIGVGNDSKLQEYTFRDDNVEPDAVEEIPIDKSLLLEHLHLCKSDEEFNAMVKEEEALIDEYSRGAYAAMLNRDYNTNSDVGKMKWDIKQGELNPGDNVVEFIREKGYDLFEIGYISGFNIENEKKDIADIPVEESTGTHTIPLTPELLTDLKKKYNLPLVKHLRTPDATNKGHAMFMGDDLIGVVMYDKSTSYVTALEVVPKYQSSGYGNYLLQMAIHDGAKKLTVTNSNKAAIKLYEKAGFKTVSTEGGRSTMVMESKSLTKKERENIPLKDYGLPDKRKYPMPDKKHVRAAIRFFNYVDKGDEGTLAKNINRKIKEYGMESEIKVGEDNRFHRYFQKHVEESVVLPIEAMITLGDFLEESNPDFLDLIKNHQNDIIFYDELDAGVSGLTGVIVAFQTEPGVGEITLLIPDEARDFGLENTLLNNFFQHIDVTNFDKIYWDIIDREENQELIRLANRYGFQELEYVAGYRKFGFTPNHAVVTESLDSVDLDRQNEIYCGRRETMFSTYAITNMPKEPEFDDNWYDSLQSAIQEYPNKENGVYFVWTKVYGNVVLLGTIILLKNDWRFQGWKTCSVFDEQNIDKLVSQVSLTGVDQADEISKVVETILTRPISHAIVTEDASGSKWLNTPDDLPVMEYSGQPRHIYMISVRSDLDGRTVTPGAGKDGKRRLCVYRSIDNALLDASEDIADSELFVYTPHPSVKLEIYRPTVVEVPQVVQTGEMWLMKPTKMSLIGAIKVTGKRNTPPRSFLRGNQVCSLYEWDWAWIEQVSEYFKLPVRIPTVSTLPEKYYALVDEMCRWDYGYVYKGKKYYGLNTDKDLKHYRTMTPEEVEKYHIGTCFDMTLYIADKIKNSDEVQRGAFEFRCYYISTKVGKDYPCHTIPLLIDRTTEKCYVLETAWKEKSGVYIYDNFIVFHYKYLNMWMEAVHADKRAKCNYCLFDPGPELYGLSCFEFMIACGQYPANDNIYNLKSMAESVTYRIGIPVMEADEDGDAPESTDYTQHAGSNPLAGGDEAGNEEGADDAGGDDASDEPFEDDGSGDMGMDDGPESTDYTEGADDMGTSDDDGGDTGTDDTATTDTTSTGEANANTLVKNYSLIKDFEKMYSLIDDIHKTIDATLKASPLENQVLAQVSRNLADAKNFITSFLQFHFKNNDFTFNLYYYEIVVQILKLNLKMLGHLPALSGKRD